MTPIRVLVVDDEEDIRTLIRMRIETAGRNIRICAEASDGAEALEALASDPHVIILDERMPGMSGIETAVQIRARRPDQLIILCTAYLDPELKAKAEGAGIRVCLAKGEIARIPATIADLTRGAA